MGIVIGLAAVVISKAVYLIEDLFEKLPIHWAWWPAIGGLAVGIVGYFYPKTLGVGYNNITDMLSGNLPFQVMLSLCFFKLISWAIALGSGTSGGTLAPLLTIGGATGALLGSLTVQWFPDAGVTVPLAALTGMSAMFAGASRAYLTSIVFALETTGQSKALLPLLASCTASYFVSYFISPNTIMTEKIARRGIRTPHSYEAGLLEHTNVDQVLGESTVISDENTLAQVRGWLELHPEEIANYYIITTVDGQYRGIVSSSNLYNAHHPESLKIGDIVKREKMYLNPGSSLRTAMELMAIENVDVLPVVENGQVSGVLSYKDIIAVYKNDAQLQNREQVLSIKRGLDTLVKRAVKK